MSRSARRRIFESGRCNVFCGDQILPLRCCWRLLRLHSAALVLAGSNLHPGSFPENSAATSPETDGKTASRQRCRRRISILQRRVSGARFTQHAQRFPLNAKGACLPACTPSCAFIVIFLFATLGLFYTICRGDARKLFYLEYIATFSLKSIFVQINFNKMLLNKSKYKVFLAIFVYMSHNIFINIQRVFSCLNTEISMNILFYDMGSYIASDTCCVI